MRMELVDAVQWAVDVQPKFDVIDETVESCGMEEKEDKLEAATGL